MIKKQLRGFTLIELLVTITIIGILAAIVLASLGDARTKAKDASIKESMAALRSQAQLDMTAKGKYPHDFCGTNASAEMARLITAITAKAYNGDFSCNNDTSSGESKNYRAYVALNIDNGATFFCVDSTGFAGEVEEEPTSTTQDCNRGAY